MVSAAPFRGLAGLDKPPLSASRHAAVSPSTGPAARAQPDLVRLRTTSPNYFLARAGLGPVMHELEDPMHTVADNAYVAYRSLKARISAELVAPEVDPLCALLLRRIWINGSSIGIAHLRIELALPPSTLSTALRRAEDRGWIRRYPNMIDARYVDAALTHAGRLVAADAAQTVGELEMDVHEAAGGEARVRLHQGRNDAGGDGRRAGLLQALRLRA